MEKIQTNRKYTTNDDDAGQIQKKAAKKNNVKMQ